MKAGNSFEVFDLYQVLPSHGESSMKLTHVRNNLTVEVFYDAIGNKIDTLIFQFENCISYDMSSFPGISMYNNERGEKMMLGSLVEYIKSDYADSWNGYFKNRNRSIKHFSILFLAENKQLNVFADTVTYSVPNK